MVLTPFKFNEAGSNNGGLDFLNRCNRAQNHHGVRRHLHLRFTSSEHAPNISQRLVWHRLGRLLWLLGPYVLFRQGNAADSCKLVSWALESWQTSSWPSSFVKQRPLGHSRQELTKITAENVCLRF